MSIASDAAFAKRVALRAARLEPNLARAMLDGFAELRAILAHRDLTKLISAGRLDAFLADVLHDQAVIGAFSKLTAELQTTLKAATTTAAKSLPIGVPGVLFNTLNPNVLAATKQLNSRVMTGLPKNVRGAIRKRVELGVAAGEAPASIARSLRVAVGLTPNQVQVVHNFRRALEGGPIAGAYSHALDYKLRDRRFDRAVENAILTRTHMPKSQVDVMVAAYERRLTAFHAETIARTAAIDATKLAQRLNWEDAIQNGAVDPARVFKRWSTVKDSRVRPEHRALEGQTVPFDAPFSNGELIPGETAYNCRCIAIYTMRPIGVKSATYVRAVSRPKTVVTQLFDAASPGQFRALDPRLASGIKLLDVPDVDAGPLQFLDVSDGGLRPYQLYVLARPLGYDHKTLSAAQRKVLERRAAKIAAGEIEPPPGWKAEWNTEFAAPAAKPAKAPPVAKPKVLHATTAATSSGQVADFTASRKLLYPGKGIPTDAERKAAKASVEDLLSPFVQNHPGMVKLATDEFFMPPDDLIKLLSKVGIKKADLKIRPYQKGFEKYAVGLLMQTPQGANLLARKITRDLVEMWALTSANSDWSVALHLAAQAEFKLTAATIKHFKGVGEARRLLTKHDALLRGFLREMHDQTQAWFRARGITHVSVLRGASIEGVTAPVSVAAKLQPMSSFSTHIEIAERFTKPKSWKSGFETLTVAEIPVEDVIGTPHTGFGCYAEFEMVVLGRGQQMAITPFGKNTIATLSGSKTKVPTAEQVLAHMRAQGVEPTGRVAIVPTHVPMPLPAAVATIDRNFNKRLAESRALFPKFKAQVNKYQAGEGAILGEAAREKAAQALASSIVDHPDLEKAFAAELARSPNVEERLRELYGGTLPPDVAKFIKSRFPTMLKGGKEVEMTWAPPITTQLPGFLDAALKAFMRHPDGGRAYAARRVSTRWISAWGRTTASELVEGLQLAAKKEFGLTSAVTKHLKITKPHQFEDMMRTWLRAMHENTQAWFRERGVTHVALVRAAGIKGVTKAERMVGKLQPMSSFSSDLATANKFGASRADGGITIVGHVPVEDVLSSTHTGFGQMDEYEWVVLGRDQPFLVAPVPAKGSHSIIKLIDEFDDAGLLDDTPKATPATRAAARAAGAAQARAKKYLDATSFEQLVQTLINQGVDIDDLSIADVKKLAIEAGYPAASLKPQSIGSIKAKARKIAAGIPVKIDGEFTSGVPVTKVPAPKPKPAPPAPTPTVTTYFDDLVADITSAMTATGDSVGAWAKNIAAAAFHKRVWVNPKNGFATAKGFLTTGLPPDGAAAAFDAFTGAIRLNQKTTKNLTLAWQLIRSGEALDYDSTVALKTYLHEQLHSMSGMQADPLLYEDVLQHGIEEGITEFYATRLASQLSGIPVPDSLSFTNSYVSKVKAISRLHTILGDEGLFGIYRTNVNQRRAAIAAALRKALPNADADALSTIVYQSKKIEEIADRIDALIKAPVVVKPKILPLPAKPAATGPAAKFHDDLVADIEANLGATGDKVVTWLDNIARESFDKRAWSVRAVLLPHDPPPVGCTGDFDPFTGALRLDPLLLQDLIEARKRVIRGEQLSLRETRALKTWMHEQLHAVSALQESPLEYSDMLQHSIEEGITEFYASRIAARLTRHALPNSLSFTDSYAGEVAGIARLHAILGDEGLWTLYRTEPGSRLGALHNLLHRALPAVDSQKIRDVIGRSKKIQNIAQDMDTLRTAVPGTTPQLLSDPFGTMWTAPPTPIPTKVKPPLFKYAGSTQYLDAVSFEQLVQDLIDQGVDIDNLTSAQVKKLAVEAGYDPASLKGQSIGAIKHKASKIAKGIVVKIEGETTSGVPKTKKVAAPAPAKAAWAPQPPLDKDLPTTGVTTFTPLQLPAELNGVAFKSWAAAPEPPNKTFGQDTKAASKWKGVAGTNPNIQEPPTTKKRAGVVIMEPDGRVWLVEPTGHYGGFPHSLPGGTKDVELSLQEAAIKEAYEETGLQVELIDFIGDTSNTRFYLARRVSGTPLDHGWETFAVKLVPTEHLPAFLKKHPMVSAIASGKQKFIDKVSASIANTDTLDDFIAALEPYIASVTDEPAAAALLQRLKLLKGLITDGTAKPFDFLTTINVHIKDVFDEELLPNKLRTQLAQLQDELQATADVMPKAAPTAKSPTAAHIEMVAEIDSLTIDYEQLEDQLEAAYDKQTGNVVFGTPEYMALEKQIADIKKQLEAKGNELAEAKLQLAELKQAAKAATVPTKALTPGEKLAAEAAPKHVPQLAKEMEDAYLAYSNAAPGADSAALFHDYETKQKLLSIGYKQQELNLLQSGVTVGGKSVATARRELAALIADLDEHLAATPGGVGAAVVKAAEQTVTPAKIKAALADAIGEWEDFDDVNTLEGDLYALFQHLTLLYHKVKTTPNAPSLLADIENVLQHHIVPVLDSGNLPGIVHTKVDELGAILEAALGKKVTTPAADIKKLKKKIAAKKAEIAGINEDLEDFDLDGGFLDDDELEEVEDLQEQLAELDGELDDLENELAAASTKAAPKAAAPTVGVPRGVSVVDIGALKKKHPYKWKQAGGDVDAFLKLLGPKAAGKAALKPPTANKKAVAKLEKKIATKQAEIDQYVDDLNYVDELGEAEVALELEQAKEELKELQAQLLQAKTGQPAVPADIAALAISLGYDPKKLTKQQLAVIKRKAAKLAKTPAPKASRDPRSPIGDDFKAKLATSSRLLSAGGSDSVAAKQKIETDLYQSIMHHTGLEAFAARYMDPHELEQHLDNAGIRAAYVTGDPRFAELVPFVVQQTNTYSGTSYTTWRFAQPGFKEAAIKVLRREKGSEWFARRVTRDLVHQWAETSMNQHPFSIALQLAAEKEFKLVHAVMDHVARDAPGALARAREWLADHEAIMRTFLRAMYKNTQTWLKRQGITHVAIVRGAGIPGITTPIVYTAKLQPMSAVASDLREAINFSKKQTAQGTLTFTIVPIEDIIGSARTGFGCLHENEWVILARNQTAVIMPYTNKYISKITGTKTSGTYGSNATLDQILEHLRNHGVLQ